jgi:hypothetical protein
MFTVRNHDRCRMDAANVDLALAATQTQGMKQLVDLHEDNRFAMCGLQLRAILHVTVNFETIIDCLASAGEIGF